MNKPTICKETWMSGRRLRRVFISLTLYFNLGLALAACVVQPDILPEAHLGALHNAADQALNLHNHDNAMLILRDAYAVDSLNVDTLELMLRLHTSLRDISSMETVALLIMQLDPDNVLALEQMGMLSLRQNCLPGARDYLTRATELNPGHWSAWNGLGIVADREEQHEEAQAYFLQALALLPGHPQILANLGWSLLLEGHYELAETRLRASLQAAPEIAITRSNLALATALQGRYDEARELYLGHYSEAVTANNLGIAALRRRDTEQAREFFRQAVNLSPRFYELAISNLQQLQQNNPAPTLVLP